VTATSAVDYRTEIETALAEGWRVRNLYATDVGREVRVLLVSPSGQIRLVTVAADADGVVPSLVDLVPAVGWDEREAHDLYGVRFSGHEPLRPLLDHDVAMDAWTVPVRGVDPYEVAVGPIHAGVIESGHFRFHVVGDRILHLDARLFYKHRGLERAAEGTTLPAGLVVISRACAACVVSNGLAFAWAAEEALGFRADAELVRVRALLLELERVWSHLNDIAAVCSGVGLAAGSSYFLALTERARRLNECLTGHRFMFGSVRVARSDLDADAATVRTSAIELDAMRVAVDSGWRELAFNASLQDRLEGVGVVDGPTAERLGVVGPAARAAGLPLDARAWTARDAQIYGGFAPVSASRPLGDVSARFEQRMVELTQSFDLLAQLLAGGPVRPSVAVASVAARPIGVGLVESPRGMTSCVLEVSGEQVTRVRLRTGSYANWPAVAYAAAGGLLPDFPLVNKSFELCYACADR
jgi:Ni,Fe-hydrogenase III large subunit